MSIMVQGVVIGIDNGYGNTKSEHTIVKSGVSISEKEPILTKDFIEVAGRYIVFGESGVAFTSDKTNTEEHYHLTLVSLVKELEHRGIRNASVILAVGLPTLWCDSDQKTAFRDYIMQKPVIELKYKDKDYHVEIIETYVFPQGFAAVAGRYDMTGRNLIVDIGSGTVDFIEIDNNRPIEKSINMERFGVRSCKDKIKKDVLSLLHSEYDDDYIDDYLINGCEGTENALAGIIANDAQEYCRELMHKIENNGYKKGITTLYLIGGGARVMKNFSDVGSVPGVIIVDDIHANAKGFADLAIQVKKRKKDM